MGVIIGITGTNGAGKGTIVEYLKTKGFKHYSVRDAIGEEIAKRGLELNRDTLIEVSNDMRSKHGPSYFVEYLFEKAKKEGSKCIIESIRTPGEIDALRKKGKFVLFAVDANKNERYRRILLRGEKTDNVTFKDFVEKEKLEMQSNDPNKQNIKTCMDQADYKFRNDSTKEDLFKKVKEVLHEI
ncbi:AAA family ATPase [Candidatus Woesearchaeota archaeon]|nr:AAA family ATPase [Candidatus Woesearchaeota archaeon]